MKIAILGLGVEGRQALNYWNKPENEITVCDANENISIPAGVNSKLGSDYLSNLYEFDLIIRSPGIYEGLIVDANSLQILSKVTTTLNEFFKISPTKNIIGITGTKGKGTTSTLVTKFLEASGRKVHLGGNVGNGFLDMLDGRIAPDDWIVLELSSFQLSDFNYAPHIGVCLMIGQDHLNWHLTFEAYLNAKKNLFLNQTADDIAIYFADNNYSKELAEASPGKKLPYYSKPGAYVEEGLFKLNGSAICPITDMKLLGKHNLQNICAAITIYSVINDNLEPIKKVIADFMGLVHRLEYIRERDGIKFYNDSYASAPDAAAVAMDAIEGNKILIIGGFDRGLDLSIIVKGLIEHNDEIRKVILIGQSAKRLSEEIQKTDFNNYLMSDSKNISEVLSLALQHARPGDSVVLSPGFASFDMFKNFEDRGIQFKEAVNNL